MSIINNIDSVLSSKQDKQYKQLIGRIDLAGGTVFYFAATNSNIQGGIRNFYNFQI